MMGNSASTFREEAALGRTFWKKGRERVREKEDETQGCGECPLTHR